LPAGLADDIPQRLLDAGNRAEQLDRAAPLRVIVGGDLGECLMSKGLRPTA